jgi:DNA mismatch repair protein MutL
MDSQSTLTPSSSLAQQLLQARFVGTLFQTYLLFETSELLCIDQHAAHERVRYEILKKRVLGNSEHHTLSSQALLLPESLPITSEQAEVLATRLPLLERLGFEGSVHQNTQCPEPNYSFLFRAIPPEWVGWKGQFLKMRLKNLLDRLLEEDLNRPELIFDEVLFEALASEACHSSIRAGDALEPMESQALLQQLLACEHPWNCPHGRPTVIKMTQEKFEEWFQRKI